MTVALLSWTIVSLARKKNPKTSFPRGSILSKRNNPSPVIVSVQTSCFHQIPLPVHLITLKLVNTELTTEPQAQRIRIRGEYFIYSPIQFFMQTNMYIQWYLPHLRHCQAPEALREFQSNQLLKMNYQVGAKLMVVFANINLCSKHI